MKVHFITKHQLTDQSSRLRVGQYLPHLRRAGLEFGVSCFYGPALQSVVYTRGNYARKVLYTGWSVLRRFAEIPRVSRNDIVFIHREVVPFFFTTIERLYRSAGCRIVYDCDDAIFLDIPSRYNPAVRWLRNPRKVHRLMTLADHLVVGNRNLAEYARPYNEAITVIPTPVDLSFYRRRATTDGQPRVATIGWMGSRFSSYYLKCLEPVFRRLLKRYPGLRLKLVDVEDFMTDEPRATLKRWSLAEELEDLHSFDIGVMPLFDDGIARYKSAFKLLQYMAVGLPVVCNPIGMNAEVVQDGENGFWATSEEEWFSRLSLLIEQPALRARMGAAGRETVERDYSVEVNCARLLRTFEEVRRGPRGGRSARP